MVLRITHDTHSTHDASAIAVLPQGQYRGSHLGLLLGWAGRDREHTGQDAAGLRVVHGRNTPRCTSSSELQRYNELGELSAIRIDEPLLTGDLDQDIAILNIVA